MSDSATPRTTARQSSPSFTFSQSVLKLRSVESVMPANHLILCRPFFCPHSFPASGSFPMSWFFASGDQNIGALASASVFPVKSQRWFPIEINDNNNNKRIHIHTRANSHSKWRCCKLICEKSLPQPVARFRCMVHHIKIWWWWGRWWGRGWWGGRWWGRGWFWCRRRIGVASWVQGTAREKVRRCAHRLPSWYHDKIVLFIIFGSARSFLRHSGASLVVVLRLSCPTVYGT